MRVLVVETGGKSGLYAYTDALCLGLAENGADVSVLTSPRWPDLPRPFDIKRHMAVMADKKYFSKLRWVADRFTKILCNTIKRNHLAIQQGFDVVHIQTGTPVIDQYLLKPLCRRIPVVLTVHDVKQHVDLFKSKRSFNERYFSIPDRLVVHYEDGKRQLIEDWGIQPDRIDVIPHGIMPLHDPFDKSKSRSVLGLPHNRKIILFFGGIRDSKGLDILLQGLKAVTAKHPDVLLVIAGRMPRGLSFDKYQNFINENNLGQHIRNTIRYIDENEVDHFFSAADLVAIPYKNFEAQSGVLLRAYGHKKPVVVSNVGAMGELVDSDGTGLVVESEQPDQLAKAILELLNDLDTFEGNYTDQLQEKYSWNRIGAQTIECYKTAIDSRN